MQKETQNLAVAKNIHAAVQVFAKDRQMNLGTAADFLLASALRLRRVPVKKESAR